MQHYARVRRALGNGRIEGAVVGGAIQRERDCTIIVLQSYNLGIKVGGHAARSFFQSDTVGLRLRWPISWAPAP